MPVDRHEADEMKREMELAGAPEHCRAVRCREWKENICRVAADVNECIEQCRKCSLFLGQVCRDAPGSPPRCEDADREAERQGTEPPVESHKDYREATGFAGEAGRSLRDGGECRGQPLP
jgi:hypothetical protein